MDYGLWIMDYGLWINRFPIHIIHNLWIMDWI